MIIVVVDDNELYAKSISDIINYKSEEHEVIRTHSLSGLDGVCSLMNVDLIMLDLHLPDSNKPIETFNTVRERYDKPIIVLSAVDDPNTINKIISAGAQDYFIKTKIQEDIIRTINVSILRYETYKKLSDAKSIINEALVDYKEEG